jgi:hypothetical protein
LSIYVIFCLFWYFSCMLSLIALHFQAASVVIDAFSVIFIEYMAELWFKSIQIRLQINCRVCLDCSSWLLLLLACQVLCYNVIWLQSTLYSNKGHFKYVCLNIFFKSWCILLIVKLFESYLIMLYPHIFLACSFLCLTVISTCVAIKYTHPDE